MTLTDEAKLSCYREIAPLSEEHGVFLVQHAESRRIFVKKVLSEYHLSVFQQLKRHPLPHTPKIEALFETDEGLIVIEEYIAGRTLAEVLAERGHLSEEETADLAGQLCVILRSLHGMEPPIIHRDIKPSNVIVNSDGAVWLLDMDASKPFDAAETRDTRLIGTVGYAAPEQYGFAASDTRTDLWSVGVLMNVMLTGGFPNERTADGRLGRIIRRCLKMDASQRYRSADELLRDLRKLPRKRLSGPTAPVDVPNAGTDDSDFGRFDTDSGTDGGKEPQKHPWAPPGFRTGTPWKAVLALIGYALIVLTGLFQQLKGPDGSLLTGAPLWFNRIGYIIALILIVLFTANYGQIHEKMQLTRIRDRRLRYVLIAVIDVVFFMAVIAVLSFFEDLL